MTSPHYTETHCKPPRVITQKFISYKLMKSVWEHIHSLITFSFIWLQVINIRLKCLLIFWWFIYYLPPHWAILTTRSLFVIHQITTGWHCGCKVQTFPGLHHRKYKSNPACESYFWNSQRWEYFLFQKPFTVWQHICLYMVYLSKSSHGLNIDGRSYVKTNPHRETKMLLKSSFHIYFQTISGRSSSSDMMSDHQ